MSRRFFHHPRPTSRTRVRSTPRLERLEDRRLLATFAPLASAADGSPDSLRAAIIAANSNGQDNSIVLQSGSYRLTVVNTAGQENAAAQGDLDLIDAGHTITIQGQGAGSTIIDGGGIDRVFQVLPGVAAILRDLTIQDGVARDDGSTGAGPFTTATGGGLFNEGTVELDRVVVQDCIAMAAPGTDGVLGAYEEGGTGAYASGGGIYNSNISGVLTLNGCIVRGNTAAGGQGGNGAFYVDSSALGGLGDNGAGGGIFNAGSFTVNQSAIVGNTAQGGAGGDGGRTLFGVGNSGGPGRDAYGGGLYVGVMASQTRIVDSTIAANTAVGGAGGPGAAGSSTGTYGLDGGAGNDGGAGYGGGIAAYAPVNLYNSTIAANEASGGAPGAGGAGGVGFPGSGKAGAPGDGGTASGGGVWTPNTPPVTPLLTSVSTIIALNTIVAGLGPDVFGTFSSVGNTLLGSGDGAAGITDGVAGNLIGVDPMLGPLQDNGGPTPTMALLPGSPALDAGSNPLNLSADQRGYAPRAVGAAAAIGAYELGADAPPPGSVGVGGKPVIHITAKVVKKRGRREILVYDAGTNALKFAINPFGKSYRGAFQVTTADVDGDGVDDLIVRRPRGHKQFITAVFSGLDGSPLPSSLA